MADAKISALPASTTPLAGTEVLPIVQSSTTRQVSVANLTAGRAISATQLTLTTGNLVIGTAGKGIDFSIDPAAAGMTSELFDDYEEGTFTPILSDSSGNNATAGFSGGVYVKVGRSISFQLYFINVNKTGLTAGDAIRISLPFTSIAGQYGSTAVRLSDVTFTTLPVGYITPSVAYLNLFEAATGATGANVLVSALTGATSDIMIAGTFQTT